MEKQAYLDRLQKEMEQKYNQEYVAVCVKYADGLLEQGLPVIFDENHLKNILKLHRVKMEYYQEFCIAGKSGKERTICAPSKSLKVRQRWILDNILYKIPISDCCEGFAKGHSIVTNAQRHIGYEQSLNIDIKDFFPSISQDRVKQVFIEMGYSREASEYLARLCCYKGKLPQGAPTSPYLANIVCRDMDEQLIQYSEEKDIIYTRYADDMSFSGNCEMIELYEEIQKIVADSGFEVNYSKTRVYKGKKRKIITGIIVKEESLAVPRDYKRKLKQEIYYCQKFGVATHLENTKAIKRVNFREYLYGKAYYIKMIEPKTGRYFLEELDKICWD